MCEHDAEIQRLSRERDLAIAVNIQLTTELHEVAHERDVAQRQLEAIRAGIR